MIEAESYPSHAEFGRAQHALDQVTTTVAIAQGLAVSGRSVQLDGLEAAAGMVCARILDLSPAQGAALRPALANLEARIAALADTLKLRSR